MTLYQVLTAQRRLIVWCKSCGHQSEPDIAELVAHHGAGTTVAHWAEGLACAKCEKHGAQFVVTGARHSPWEPDSGR